MGGEVRQCRHWEPNREDPRHPRTEQAQMRESSRLPTIAFFATYHIVGWMERWTAIFEAAFVGGGGMGNSDVTEVKMGNHLIVDRVRAGLFNFVRLCPVR